MSMTKEEAEGCIKSKMCESCGTYLGGGKCRDTCHVVEVLKALKQESMIDKVRAEIVDTAAYEKEVHGKTEFLAGINYCLSIIEKYYRAKSEDK